MKNMPLSDASQIPLPPDEVKIIDFQAEPHEDGKRVLVNLTFTPFQENPSAEILVSDQNGQEVLKVNIIETIDPNTEITIHLPPEETKGEYRITANAFYPDKELSEDEMGMVRTPDKTAIGTAETTFIIPK